MMKYVLLSLLVDSSMACFSADVGSGGDGSNFNEVGSDYPGADNG